MAAPILKFNLQAATRDHELLMSLTFGTPETDSIIEQISTAMMCCNKDVQDETAELLNKLSENLNIAIHILEREAMEHLKQLNK